MTFSCDVAIIGAGPGGYTAAIRASQLGFKTVCVDKRGSLGGTCLNVGCIPSKALLQVTELYDLLKHDSASFGIEHGGLCADFSAMMHRKDLIVSGLTEGIAGLFKRNGVTYIHGSAKFISPSQLEVRMGESLKQAKEVIEAKHFIIASGSEPIALPFLPFDEKTVVSSTGALCFSEVPKKLIVIGAGVIGVELASVFCRLGSKVEMIEMLDRICPAMDSVISQALLKSLKKQGISFSLSSQVVSGKITQNGGELCIKKDHEEAILSADKILVAVGRRPFSEGLGLAQIGVQMTPKGFVVVDKSFCTSVANLFAIGDLIEGPMLAHRASEEGVAVVESIAGRSPHLNYMAIPNVIYTNPEAAAVGLTEQEAADVKMQIFVGTSYFKANPRARCMGALEGFVKIIGEKTSGRLIGMHIIGPHASEIIAEGVIAIEKKATVKDIAYASHAHPTLSEAIKEAAIDALLHETHV